MRPYETPLSGCANQIPRRIGDGPAKIFTRPSRTSRGFMKTYLFMNFRELPNLIPDPEEANRWIRDVRSIVNNAINRAENADGNEVIRIFDDVCNRLYVPDVRDLDKDLLPEIVPDVERILSEIKNEVRRLQDSRGELMRHYEDALIYKSMVYNKLDELIKMLEDEMESIR